MKSLVEGTVNADTLTVYSLSCCFHYPHALLQLVVVFFSRLANIRPLKHHCSIITDSFPKNHPRTHPIIVAAVIMTFIISLFYDPSRVKRARYKRGPFWWRWFKDQYIYDYCCVYLYGWLTKRFWVVGSKIADPNIRVRPEHALDKSLWPLMAGPQYKFFVVMFFLMCVCTLIKNMKR